LAARRVELCTITASNLVDEYDQLAEAIDRATARKKEILDELIKMAGSKNADIFGRKLTRVEREGAVSYAKAVKDHLPDLDLAPYRGKPSEHWRLT
jgi:hypothetical protein